jgi:hypothetical protein
MTEAIPAVCEFCVNRNHRADIRCTEACHSLDAYNKVIAEAIAARDKEWIEWGSQYCDKAEHGVQIYRYECYDCWQERKRSLGL